MTISMGSALRPRLVMITGPIASGKSSVADEVARGLRAAGLSVALTENASFLRADHDRYASQAASLPCDLRLVAEDGDPREHALRIVERLLG